MKRRWGPSSEHSRGVVVHIFADGHVQALLEDIDLRTYKALITRRGGESVDLNAF